jgi:UDP-N-acetylglucosamine--N-acetylmuramyl-(pentapeptide) pyrophosphoryl-undecaprenol N-acetylglucosamine transferase
LKKGSRETYLFAGGGTGGHLYPAIALVEGLKQVRPNSDIHFVGTPRGIESRVIPALGFPLHLIAVRGLRRSLTPANLLVPFVLFWSFLQCSALLIKLRPAVVIGTGGYVSGPVLLTAALLRFPTLIQEQNSYPGVTTRLLARLVSRVHISFEESRRFFSNRRIYLSGNPVRSFETTLAPKQARIKLGLQPERQTLLVFGGSQGAQALNAALLGCLKDVLAQTDLQILWSTGKTDFETVQRAVQSFSDRVRVFNFISDMESAYRASSLAVARAGALTLAELTVCGLPSILVPYPFAAANHQETNARALEAAGAALVILQQELTPHRLSEMICELTEDREKRAGMAKSALQAAFPNATREIVNSILNLTEFTENKEV